MIENLRRNWWMILVSFVAFVFALTLPVFLICSLPYRAAYALRDAGQLAAIAGLILGAIFALASFSWLHHPRKTRFYHSLPFTRTRHFMTRAAVMTVAFLVGLLVNYTISVLRLYVVGFGSLVGSEALLYLLLKPLLAYCISASLMLLCMQLCGRLWAAFLLYGLMMAGLACILLSINAICQFVFDTYWDATLGQVGKFCCPPVWAYELEESPWAYGGAALILSFLAFGAAWLLYKKRPSERAGKLLAFPGVWLPAKLFCVAFVALGLGTILMEFNMSAGLLVFGVLAGCVLSHMGAEAARSGQWKGVLRAWPCLIACVAVFGLLLGVALTDALGYDTYVPRKDKVQEATLTINGEEYPFTSQAGTYAAWDLVSVLRDEQPAAHGSSYIGEIRADLKLKNGTHFRRTYAFDGVWTSQMEEAARALVSMDEFRMANVPVPPKGEKEYIEVLARSGDSYMAMDLAETLTGEEMTHFLALYEKDCLDRTLEDLQGGVRYRLNISSGELWDTYPVYAGDQLTVEFLSGRELIRQKEQLTGQKVTALALYADGREVARFTDREEIRAILPLAMSKDYMYNDPNFFDYREIYEIRCFEDSEENYFDYAFIRREALPSWADPGLSGPLHQRGNQLSLKEGIVVTRPIPEG